MTETEKTKVDPDRELKKQVAYCYDPRNGHFVGTDTAWESPLEPDVFHVPAFSTLTPVPPFDATQIAFWHQNKWNVIKRPDPVIIGK